MNLLYFCTLLDSRGGWEEKQDVTPPMARQNAGRGLVCIQGWLLSLGTISNNLSEVLIERSSALHINRKKHPQRLVVWSQRCKEELTKGGGAEWMRAKETIHERGKKVKYSPGTLEVRLKGCSTPCWHRTITAKENHFENISICFWRNGNHAIEISRCAQYPLCIDNPNHPGCTTALLMHPVVSMIHCQQQLNSKESELKTHRNFLL